MHIELASDARAEPMIDFLIEHFFPFETMCKSLQFVLPDQAKPLLLRRFSGNLSLLLIDDVTNEIIGVRTIIITHKDTRTFETSDDMVEKVKTIYTFLTFLNKKMDVFAYFGVDTAIHFINLGIHKQYRNRGLASKLMEAAMSFCGQTGLSTPCIKVEATSLYSQKIFEKLGFEALNTVYFADYKVNDEVVFKNTEPTTKAVMYVKRL